MRKGFAGIGVALALAALPGTAAATHSNGAGPKMDLIQGSGRGHIPVGPQILEDQGHINAHSDGLFAEGKFWIRFGGAELRGSVECLTVVGRDARWSGPIEESSDPRFPAGAWVYGRDIDNGEGRNAPPDEHGGVVDFPPPQGTCDTRELPTLPLTQGNLVAHDGA
jgi:hypothetical protein